MGRDNPVDRSELRLACSDAAGRLRTKLSDGVDESAMIAGVADHAGHTPSLQTVLGAVCEVLPPRAALAPHHSTVLGALIFGDDHGERPATFVAALSMDKATLRRGGLGPGRDLVWGIGEPPGSWRTFKEAINTVVFSAAVQPRGVAVGSREGLRRRKPWVADCLAHGGGWTRPYPDAVTGRSIESFVLPFESRFDSSIIGVVIAGSLLVEDPPLLLAPPPRLPAPPRARDSPPSVITPPSPPETDGLVQTSDVDMARLSPPPSHRTAAAATPSAALRATLRERWSQAPGDGSPVPPPEAPLEQRGGPASRSSPMEPPPAAVRREAKARDEASSVRRRHESRTPSTPEPAAGAARTRRQEVAAPAAAAPAVSTFLATTAGAFRARAPRPAVAAAAGGQRCGRVASPAARVPLTATATASTATTGNGASGGDFRGAALAASEAPVSVPALAARSALLLQRARRERARIHHLRELIHEGSGSPAPLPPFPSAASRGRSRSRSRSRGRSRGRSGGMRKVLSASPEPETSPDTAQTGLRSGLGLFGRVSALLGSVLPRRNESGEDAAAAAASVASVAPALSAELASEAGAVDGAGPARSRAGLVPRPTKPASGREAAEEKLEAAVVEVSDDSGDDDTDGFHSLSDGAGSDGAGSVSELPDVSFTEL